MVGYRGICYRYCQMEYIHYLGISRYSYLFKNSLISLPNCNKSLISSVRELHRWPCQKSKTPIFSVFFISVQPPGLNRDRPECRRHAWPIREYTIRKIIKTEFLSPRVFIDFYCCVSRRRVQIRVFFQYFHEFVNSGVKT